MRPGITAFSRLSLRARPSTTTSILGRLLSRNAAAASKNPLFQARNQSTQTNEAPQQIPPASPLRRLGVISPVITVLLISGMGVTAYGMYELYGTLTLWPPEVRKDLRAGIRAKHRNDLDLASWYFARAWEISKTLPDSAFGALPHLKTSGIGIALAEVLELDHKPHKAYFIYEDVLKHLQNIASKDPLSAPERLRAISISYRLGELAEALGKEKEEEEHLTWAVEAILHSSSTLPTSEDEVKDQNDQAAEEESLDLDFNTKTMMEELSLAQWATKTDLAAPFEALGTYYARHEKGHYAVPLYLHAISILIPPAPARSTPEESCRGAQLMSVLSELILQHSGQDLTQAESWALKALDIATRTRQQASFQDPTCEVAYAVALFNVAAIRRMAGDNEKAKKLLEMSLKQSEAIGMTEGVEHAQDALRRIAEESAQAAEQV